MTVARRSVCSCRHCSACSIWSRWRTWRRRRSSASFGSDYPRCRSWTRPTGPTPGRLFWHTQCSRPIPMKRPKNFQELVAAFLWLQDQLLGVRLDRKQLQSRYGWSRARWTAGSRTEHSPSRSNSADGPCGVLVTWPRPNFPDSFRVRRPFDSMFWVKSSSSCSDLRDFSAIKSESLPSHPYDDFEVWKRDFQKRIDRDRERDPRTVWGWAFRAFRG